MSKASKRFDPKGFMVPIGSERGLWFHRSEQWDLGCLPWLVVGLFSPNVSSRWFCVWKWGLEVGPFGISEKAVRFGPRAWRVSRDRP